MSQVHAGYVFYCLSCPEQHKYGYYGSNEILYVPVSDCADCKGGDKRGHKGCANPAEHIEGE